MKPIISLLLAAVLHFTANAQQGDDKSLLWQISGNHLSKPSYLFGTMHMLCAEDYVWTGTMKESLKKSDKVCFEMNLNDPSVVMQAANGFLDKSGKTLESYFTPEQYKELEKYFKDKVHMDLTMFQQMKPMGLQSMLLMFAVKCSDPVSYEDSIMKTSLAGGKDILGLEDAREQLDVLDSIPTDTVIAQLMDQIHHESKNDQEYAELTGAYKKQDLPRLYALIRDSKDLGDDDMGIFLDDRNKKWISRMQAKMNNTSVFFAVGAGHLWGDNGVISLLRQAGYTVEPLK